jgi:DNA polymerase IV
VGNKPPDPPASPFEDEILESYQEELVVETVKGQAKEEGTYNGGWERDALDDIIDEAKATSHLVSDITVDTDS